MLLMSTIWTSESIEMLSELSGVSVLGLLEMEGSSEESELSSLSPWEDGLETTVERDKTDKVD